MDFKGDPHSPEQDAGYRRLLELMEGAPEWNDVEVIHSRTPAHSRRQRWTYALCSDR